MRPDVRLILAATCVALPLTLLAAPSSFDLVISDLAMPGMNGEELIARLAQIRPDLPILVASGYLENARERLLTAGIARAVLAKPVKRPELARAIADALKSR